MWVSEIVPKGERAAACICIWEEILKRFESIEVLGEPKRPYSSFIKGYETLPVRISA